MKRLNFIKILIMVIAGLVISTAHSEEAKQPAYDKSITDSEALDIAEVTFRYQFEKNASGAQKNAKAYFLVVFGNDPSLEFIKRFESHKPEIKKGSEFEIGKGLKFNVSRIKRISETKVEVSGGYYEASLSASGNTYTVELKDGKWVVTGNKMHWIS